ncbi:hypothetical protein [Reyranella soli]|uniref:PepSY domain-containing protein n=1 Tax=Reyranella soli TaxID=1230389 RepID=A0A512NIC7_9HYPH|nr:hypothetical protein [Reyranella soli]GEP58699.1 hypothetical protein RSO01_58650 [Reyranella soli]
MKRGIVLATLMMTAAGVASANLLTTAPAGVTSPWSQAQPAAESVPVITRNSADRTVTDKPAADRLVIDRPATDKRTAQLAPTAPAKVASAQTTKSMVEASQAPVPFKLKPRPPVNLPPTAEKATEAKATDKATDRPAETATDPAVDAGGENAARAAIEADGYKGVKVLRKGTNGVWYASALRGKTTVMLTVDASGSVTAD